MGRICLIDGDVLCYSACPPRMGDELFIHLDSKGRKTEKEFSEEEDRRYLEASWERFKKSVPELLDRLFCNEYMMAVKGDYNFRNTVYPDYKMNRHTSDRIRATAFVPAIRELAVIEDYAVASHGLEADDLLRIWANECRQLGKEYIIVSIDKDLKCIPGKHYNLKHKVLEEVSEFEAMFFYYQQILQGDSTDNIPGVPGIGPVKAKKILSLCREEWEFQEAVVGVYLEMLGDNWYDWLVLNTKMIHLQRFPGDFDILSSWPIIQELL
jgi:DNA polymerase-1